MAMGRQSRCLRCDQTVPRGSNRYKLTREAGLYPPADGRFRAEPAVQSETIGYLCIDCGDILADGDVLTFDEPPVDYSETYETPRQNPRRNYEGSKV